MDLIARDSIDEFGETKIVIVLPWFRCSDGGVAFDCIAGDVGDRYFAFVIRAVISSIGTKRGNDRGCVFVAVNILP